MFRRKKKSNTRWQGINRLTEENIENWNKEIDILIEKQPKTHTWEEIEKIAPLLKRARDAGLSLRQISRVIGVSHTEVANWLKVLDLDQGSKTNAQDS